MLVLTNQTIGNAEGQLVGFQFDKAEFRVEEKDGSRIIAVETNYDTYVLCSIEDMDKCVAELERLAAQDKKGAAFDDKNVYKQLE